MSQRPRLRQSEPIPWVGSAAVALFPDQAATKARHNRTKIAFVASATTYHLAYPLLESPYPGPLQRLKQSPNRTFRRTSGPLRSRLSLDHGKKKVHPLPPRTPSERRLG